MQRSYFIAEIGVNHEGSIDLAKEIILEAKEGGADCVKFQTYKANLLASKNSPSYWSLDKEPTKSQYELFKKYDSLDTDDYVELFNFCEVNEIEFLTTPFDIDAVHEMDPLLKRYKVASADITNIPLLNEIVLKKKPVIISTGASTKDEIKFAVELFLRSGNQNISLLHCVLNYPTPISDAYMAMMLDLKNEFPNLTVGYSDHTLPNYPFVALMQSLMVGGKIIEKHFTNDKTKTGNDHYHAFDKDDLKMFRDIEHEYIQAWGNISEKKPTPNEKSAIKNARRSVVAKDLMNEGHVIAESDLIMKRPGTGISPVDMNKVVGRTVTAAIKADEIINWEKLSR